MSSRLAILALIALRAFAQPGVCTVFPLVTTGCAAAVAPVTGTPTFPAYITDVNTAVTAIQASYASLPQPLTASGGQLVGTASSFVNAGAPFNSTSKEIAYMQLIALTGATYVDLNWDPIQFAQSPYYAAICALSGGTCVSGGGTGTNYNLYRSLASAAQTAGLGLRIAWGPLSNTWSNCPNISNPATATAAQIASCLGPLEAAAATDFSHLSPAVAIVDETVSHEPTGFWSLTLGTLSAANWNVQNTALCGWVTGQTAGAAIKCGTGFLSSDTAYVSSTIANESGVINYLGFDIYFGKTPGSWASPIFSNYMSFCEAAVAGGFGCKVNEFAVIRWCPSGGTNCNESDAYLSCGDSIFDSTRVNSAVMTAVAHGMAAAGASYVTMFSTQPWILFSTPALNTASQCEDTSSTGYTAYILDNLPASLTSTGAAWESAIARGNVSAQGFVSFSGKIVFGAAIQLATLPAR